MGRRVCLWFIAVQNLQHRLQRAAQARHIHRAARHQRCRCRGFDLWLSSMHRCSTHAVPQLIEPVARAVDRKALLIQQLANASNQQHFMMLVVPTIAASLDGLELRELLLPLAQHMRFDRAQITHLTNGEVALGRNRRQVDPLRVFIGSHEGQAKRSGVDGTTETTELHSGRITRRPLASARRALQRAP